MFVREQIIRLLKLSVFLICVSSYGQNAHINDTLPDILFKNVINYKSDTLRLSEFRGKTIILDFWSHYCLSCLTGLPIIDSLQNEFSDRLQFIMVNRESKEKTKLFKTKKKYLKWPSVPMITEDSVLHQFFPANGYPYHIWINKDGNVEYASMAYNTTRQNLTTYFSDGNVNIKSLYTSEQHRGKSTSIPALVNLQLLYGSFISRGEYHPLLTPNLDAPNIYYSYIKNSSIENLFRRAFSNEKYNFYPSYTIILDVDTLSNYIYPKNANIIDNWVVQNAYNYQLILPVEQKHNRYKKMQMDLQNYFNIEATITKKSIKGYALVKTKDYKPLKRETSPGFSNMNTIGEGTDSICQITNKPFSELLSAIQSSMWLYYPFEDRTNINKKDTVSIYFTCDSLYPLNVEALKHQLKKFKLDLIDAMIEEDVLILKKRSDK